MADRERRIQEIAYLLWEQEGRPDGESERFWHLAVEQYEVEAALAPADAFEEPTGEAEPSAVTVEPAEAPAEAPQKHEAEKPATVAKPKTPKVKADKPKAAKAKSDDATAVAAKAAESAPTVKPADKPKPAKRKSWF